MYLSLWKRPAPPSREDHLHNKNGNRLAVERRTNAADATPAQTDSYTTTPGTNRLASIASSAGTRSLAYDARGNLSGETRPGGLSVTASYDGHARLTGYSQGATVLAHSYMLARRLCRNQPPSCDLPALIGTVIRC